jgi:hypothetical protein
MTCRRYRRASIAASRPGPEFGSENLRGIEHGWLESTQSHCDPQALSTAPGERLPVSGCAYSDQRVV